jgi:hypothetical protein
VPQQWKEDDVLMLNIHPDHATLDKPNMFQNGAKFSVKLLSVKGASYYTKRYEEKGSDQGPPSSWGREEIQDTDDDSIYAPDSE